MINRRALLRSGLGAAAASGLVLPAHAKTKTLRIGYVSPQTGPLSSISAADSYMIDKFLKAAPGLGLDVQVSVKDSQSNPNRAAEVTKELVSRDKVQLLLVASTPDTTNPVCSVAEQEEIPVISTMTPWQSWFIGQQGNPGDPKSWQPFDYAYHFFWGLEDNVAVFTNIWNSVSTNKKVGALWPNDTDGNAWASDVGMPPTLKKTGYQLADPGRYQDLTDDYSAQINAFKQADCDILVGVPIPPDFATFWTQAKQKGFKPKIASIAKAVLYPETVAALGPLGHNITNETWWTPQHPFKSSLTGESAAQLAKGFEVAAKRQWTMPIGFIHALFEVAADAIKRTDDPRDAKALAAAISKTNLDTVCGKVQWGRDNVPAFARKNISKTPLVGGQWRRKGDGSFDLVIVENGVAPEIPLTGKLEILS